MPFVRRTVASVGRDPRRDLKRKIPIQAKPAWMGHPQGPTTCHRVLSTIPNHCPLPLSRLRWQPTIRHPASRWFYDCLRKYVEVNHGISECDYAGRDDQNTRCQLGPLRHVVRSHGRLQRVDRDVQPVNHESRHYNGRGPVEPLGIRAHTVEAQEEDWDRQEQHDLEPEVPGFAGALKGVA